MMERWKMKLLKRDVEEAAGVYLYTANYDPFFFEAAMQEVMERSPDKVQAVLDAYERPTLVQWFKLNILRRSPYGTK